MDSVRDRVGSLGSTKLRLAGWRETPYIRQYTSVLPAQQDIPGAEGKISADPNVRYWSIDDWSGGEGEDIWRDGLNAYRYSYGVVPNRRGALEVGAYIKYATATTGAEFSNGVDLIGVAKNKAWTFDSGYAYPTPKTGSTVPQFGPGVSGTLNEVVSMCDGLNDWIYVGTSTAGGTNGIQRFKEDGTTQTHYAGWGTVPDIAFFNGNVYALDGNDLYLVDQSAATTRTLVADPSAPADRVYSNTSLGMNYLSRITATDVGVAWFNTTANGVTSIYEYNESIDSYSVTGVLPGWATPDSIMYALGFVFVGMRLTDLTFYSGIPFPSVAAVADKMAFIYYQRGSQKGTLGPLPSTNLAGKQVALAGTYGDRLVFTYDKGAFGYDFSTGGVTNYALLAGAGVGHAIVYGPHLLVQSDNGANADAVEQVALAKYSTLSSNRLDTGRFDFGWLGIDKILVDVTVTAYIPITATLRLAVRAEDGSFTTHADTMDNTETSHTFTISNGTSSLTGKDFEVRLIPYSSSTASTPTIHSVTARATTALKQVEWAIEVDVSSSDGARDGDALDGPSILAALKTMAATNQMWTLTDPWHVSEYAARETFSVVVDSVTLPDSDEGGMGFARVNLRGMSGAY